MGVQVDRLEERVRKLETAIKPKPWWRRPIDAWAVAVLGAFLLFAADDEVVEVWHYLTGG